MSLKITSRGDKIVPKHMSKDPLVATRAPSAYFLFTADKRPELKLQNPTLTYTGLSKTIGALWTSLSDRQKIPYTSYSQEVKLLENNGLTTDKADAEDTETETENMRRALFVGSNIQTTLLTDAEGNQYEVPLAALQPVFDEDAEPMYEEKSSSSELAVIGSLFNAIGDLAKIGSKTVADMSGENFRVGAIGSKSPPFPVTNLVTIPPMNQVYLGIKYKKGNNS